MLLWTHAQDSSPMSSSSFSFHSIAHERVLFQRDPVSGSNCALGGKDARRWTPSDPFRPDKFGNRIAIFVSIFDQIIHVSHSRSRERQPKLLAAPRGFTEDPREGRNIGRASRRSPPSACTLLLSQSRVNELVSKIFSQYCSLESHQAAAPDFPTTSLLPLRSQGDAAFLGIPTVAGSLY